MLICINKLDTSHRLKYLDYKEYNFPNKMTSTKTITPVEKVIPIYPKNNSNSVEISPTNYLSKLGITHLRNYCRAKKVSKH